MPSNFIYEAIACFQKVRSFPMYRDFLKVLDDPNTKRMLLDSRQAAVFADLGTDGLETFQGKLKLPFNQFYVELTEPIEIGTPEGDLHDLLRAIMIYPNNTRTLQGHQIYNLVLLFRNTGDNDLVDREFGYCPETGECFVSKGVAMSVEKFASRNVRHKILEGLERSTLPENWSDDKYFAAGSFIAELPMRKVGWWEQVVVEYGAFFSWFLSYAMSKSMRIVQLPLSKADRKGKRTRLQSRPMPWHVITVEPKFSSGQVPTGETVHQHGYRYDVIGHLRFGRHKTKTGEYTRSIEWVAPHQRGLKNTLYIPKTYSVKGGKTVSPKMSEYFHNQP